MRSRVASVLFVAALAAISRGQITKTSKGYLFRLKFVQGRSYTYSFLVDMTTPTSASPMRVEGPLNIRILSVKGQTANVQATVGPLSMAGQTMPQQSTTVQETTTGRIVGGGDQIQQLAIPLPSTPKKPGETWTGSTKLGLYGSTEKVATKYRFTGIARAGGHELAHLKVSLTGSGQTTINGSGDIYLLVADGSMWQSTTRFSLALQQVKMRGTTAITRK